MQINRAGMVAAALAVLLVGSAGGALYLWLWSPLATLDQRIGAATASLTAGALAIAVVAGVVALQAYRDALKRPRLQLSIDAVRANYLSVTPELTNDGTASAQNAIVWMQIRPSQQLRHGAWAQDPAGDLRWDAPAGVLIHPMVPSFVLPTATLMLPPTGEPLRITYTVAADGVAPFTGEVQV